ncbi:MAG: ADP-ribose diphosphatase [Rhodocyclaceae bacterium]
MSDRGFEILSREICYEGFFRLERLRLRHSLHAGGMGPVLVRERVERGDVAAVLPYDPVRDEVVLIEQFRVGALDDPGGAWMTEVVAGLIEPGETPEEVARREAVEEAGCILGELVPIARFYASPAKSSERSHLFCGRADASDAGGIHGLAHEGEDIRVLPMAFDEAWSLLRSGGIDSAWPIIALQWLAANREALRRRWCEGSAASFGS